MQTTYTRGYKTSLTKQQLSDFYKKFNKKSITISLFYIFTYHLSIYISVYLLVVSNLNLFLSIIILVFVARQLRALENIVHFGSHYNISSNKKLNDIILNILCAYPVMQSVKSYRKFHTTHHQQYGASNDPCKNRFQMLSHKKKDENKKPSIFPVLKLLPRYFINYYKEIGSNPKMIMIFLLYNIVGFLFHMFIFGVEFSYTFILIYNCSLFLILPIIRSVAEFDEHDYMSGDNLIDTTYNNLSTLDFLLFHPAGDAYHVVHHLYPAIPWWKQREAHHFLMTHDTSYKNKVQNR